MVVFGILLILLAAGLLVGNRLKSRGADELRGVERRQAGELSALVTEIGAEIGQGAFRERAEIVGQIECDAPLTSPLGEKPCLHYDMTVRREYEETYYDRDSQGREQRRTRRSSDVVSQEQASAVFRVRDATGALLVQPDGARFDGLVKSVDRFDHGDANELSVGRFVMSLASQLAGGRRTLGYKYEEKIPLDRNVTVIGQVSDEMGEVALRKGEGKLLVSTRTREELVRSAQKTAKIFLVLGLIGLGGGLALVIAGIVDLLPAHP